MGPIPGIAQYLIAGVPDPRGLLGQVVWAFVVPEPTLTRPPQAFLAHARQRLPPHMMPRSVIVVPELPLIGPGKPDRRRTLALYATSPQDNQNG